LRFYIQMIGLELKPELEELVDNIGKRNGYYGNKISPSIMRMFEIEVRDDGAGILVPYWIGVLQKGRGPWLGKNRGTPLLRVIIYNWMRKKGLFKSKTEAGKRGEAFVIARSINKRGNVHFRSKTFVDVFETERKKTIKKIDDKFGILIGKITMDVI